MKLTTRGRDYLKATFVLALISSFFDIKSMIALAFALMVAASLSYIILASITLSTTKVVFEPEIKRQFKGDEFPVTISVIFKRAQWISIHLSSLKMPMGVIVKTQEVKEGSIKMLVKSAYAGLFSKVQIRLELTDTLGLFSKEFQTINPQFTLESLPNSILARVNSIRAFSLSTGDRSARAHGSSLELYALDEYRPFNETKDLLWKKIARMPDEKLIVKVRDSLIPKVVKIGLVENVERNPEMKLRFVDLFCEAIGTLCNHLFVLGTLVEILISNQEGKVESLVISEVERIGDVLIETLKRKDRPKEISPTAEIIMSSNIVISGLLELGDELIASVISKKPSLLIEDENVKPPLVVGEQAIVYSGTQDLRKLVSRVVER